jgi:diketogulonate reductase-like aldo/keto reductase
MEEIIKQTYTLNNGSILPIIGMGTSPMKGKELTSALFAAVDCGYRLFDTAFAYKNEESLGISLKEIFNKKEISRRDIYITTKVGEDLWHGIPDGKLFYKEGKNEHKDIFQIVKKQVESSLKCLKTEYINLVLIHWPFPDYLTEIWRSLEDLYQAGLINAIGVSNFHERHLKKIISTCKIKPMVNQIEISPINTRENLVKYCHDEQIQIQVYSPLSNSRLTKVKDNAVIQELCLKYNCTLHQLILRWDIQRNLLPIPKASTFEHLKENSSLNFEIDEDDMIFLSSFNEDYQHLPESIFCPGY